MVDSSRSALDPDSHAESTIFDLVELILKDLDRLDRLTRSTRAQRELSPRLMGVGIVGYVIFGLTLAMIFTVAGKWPEAISIADWLKHPQQSLIRFQPLEGALFWQHWLDGSAFKLTAAFVLGLVGAIGICLNPSFYFYGLLA